MPVPSNQTIDTAIDIGTLTGYDPYVIAQDAWDGSQTVDDLWYKYLPVAGDVVLEVAGLGDVTNYRVQGTFWSGPAESPTQLGGTADNTPTQRDVLDGVTPGEYVYFQFHKTSVGNHNPSILNLRIARGQNQDIAAGNILINDSSPGYPGVVMSQSTAIPTKFISGFASGEGCVTLRNGIIAAIESSDSPKGLRIYTPSKTGITLSVTPSMPTDNYIKELACNQFDTFWAAENGIAAHIVSVLADGTVGTPIALGSACATLAPNLDGSKIYFATSLLSTAVLKVVDTATGTITTFLPSVAGKFYGANIMMMTDNTLLVPYEQSGVDTFIRRYDENAVQIGSDITLTGVQNALEKIFADPNDPNFFWVWWQDATLNHFQKISTATGLAVVSISRMKFIEGISQEGAVATSSVYSGADYSCVPIVIRLAGSSGIYQLVADQHHDELYTSTSPVATENVPIPDPSFITYFAGDE